MKRQILIVAVAVVLVVPLSSVALAREGYRDDIRHSRDREREDRYVVHYHLDGGSGRVRVKSEDRADRVVDLLRSVGADAHLDDSRVVHFSMRGKGRLIRRSHEDAHRLAQKLVGYGFDAHVDHE